MVTQVAARLLEYLFHPYVSPPMTHQQDKASSLRGITKENSQFSSDHSFNEKILARSVSEFFQAVFDANQNRIGSTELEAYEGLGDDVARACKYFAKRSDACARIDYLFSDDFLSEVEDSFNTSGYLPMLRWFTAALEENPFLEASDSWNDDSLASSGATVRYWTKESQKAKDFMDSLLEKDAKTLSALAERVRESVTSGLAPKWLTGSK